MNGSARGVLDILDENTRMNEKTVMPFLQAANRIVTDQLSGANVNSSTLAHIENWLAAHLIAMSDRETGVVSEKGGDVSVTYTGQTGLGLDATRYGQVVKVLDPTGKLANAGKRRAGFVTLDFISGGSI